MCFQHESYVAGTQAKVKHMSTKGGGSGKASPRLGVTSLGLSPVKRKFCTCDFWALF